MKRGIFLFAFLATALQAQVAVSAQTTTGNPSQTVTATAKFKKIPAITATVSCPGVPVDSTGDFQVIAGTSVTCQVVLSAAPAAAATLSITSADPTQFTAPASVTVAAGSTTSAAFQVTATP